MYTKSLAAVGGPDASMEPARVAARMASHDGASLTFVSVHRPTSTAFGDPDYSDRLLPRLAEAEHSLEQARQVALREGIDDVIPSRVELPRGMLRRGSADQSIDLSSLTGEMTDIIRRSESVPMMPHSLANTTHPNLSREISCSSIIATLCRQ